MSLIWEFWGTFSSQKELIDFSDSLPTSYAPPGLLDAKRPKKIVGLVAKGVGLSDVMTLQNSLDSQIAETAFKLADKSSIIGFVTSFSADPIEHAAVNGETLYNIKIGLRIDGTLTINWHYWGEYSTTKEYLEFYGGINGTVVPYTLIASKPAKKLAAFSAHGATLAEAIAAWTLCDTDGAISLISGDGYSCTGLPTAFQATPIEHTGRYTMRVTLRIDGDTTPRWQYYGDYSAEKEITTFYGAPGASGAYGPVTNYDQKLPKKIATAVAKGVTSVAAFEWYANIDTPNYQANILMSDGISLTGPLVAVSISQQEFTTLYDVHLQVKIQ